MDPRNKTKKRRPSEAKKVKTAQNSPASRRSGSAEAKRGKPHRPMTRAEARRYREKKARLRRKRRMARIRRRCLAVVSVVAFIAAIGLLANYMIARQQELQNMRTQQELLSMFTDGTAAQGLAEATAAAESVVPEATDFAGQADHSTAEPPNDALPEPEQTAEAPVEQTEPVVSDRFVELVKENPDVTGWLVAGSDISTPVVQRDNEYYMDHDFYGNKSSAGTVFVDELCADWDIEQYKIFYGHNMRNGSMFGKLDGYMDLAYLKENASFEYHSAYNNEISYYVPFAIIDASMDKQSKDYFFLRRFNIFREPRDEQSIDEFIAELQQRSMYAFEGVDVTAEDNIICLVTCTYELNDARLMVFCREVREGETAEAMTRLVQEHVIKK